VKFSLDGQIQNNLVLSNLSYNIQSQSGLGGGIFCSAVSNLTLVNNTIVGNNAPGVLNSGGASIYLLYPDSLAVANNIIAFNSSGILLYPGSATPSIFRNDCVDNPVNYSGGLSAGPGDINIDPQFVNGSAGDYHLLATSPCIDAGFAGKAATTDFDSVPRPLDGNNDGTAAFDMGAFEFIHPTADTDHDGAPDEAEIIAGTNPTDPLSFLSLQPRLIANTTMALNWSSVTGRTYTIQFKSSLTSGTWQTLTNNISGTGQIIQVQDSVVAGNNRFYRLQVTR
jgi:hypothetical protein